MFPNLCEIEEYALLVPYDTFKELVSWNSYTIQKYSRLANKIGVIRSTILKENSKYNIYVIELPNGMQVKLLDFMIIKLNHNFIPLNRYV